MVLYAIRCFKYKGKFRGKLQSGVSLMPLVEHETWLLHSSFPSSFHIPFKYLNSTYITGTVLGSMSHPSSVCIDHLLLLVSTITKTHTFPPVWTSLLGGLTSLPTSKYFSEQQDFLSSPDPIHLPNLIKVEKAGLLNSLITSQGIALEYLC